MNKENPRLDVCFEAWVAFDAAPIEQIGARLEHLVQAVEALSGVGWTEGARPMAEPVPGTQREIERLGAQTTLRLTVVARTELRVCRVREALARTMGKHADQWVVPPGGRLAACFDPDPEWVAAVRQRYAQGEARKRIARTDRVPLSRVERATAGTERLADATPTRRLSVEEVRTARRLRRERWSYLRLAARYPVSDVALRKAVTGRTYGEIPGAIPEHEDRAITREMRDQGYRREDERSTAHAGHTYTAHTPTLDT